MYLSILEKTIIFLIPTQLGFHFWPYFSRVAGIKIDYLSPTIYLLDILIILYVVGSYSKIIELSRSHPKTLATIILAALVNILFSISPLNSIVWWSRTFLYLALLLSFVKSKISWDRVGTPLVASAILVVILQTAQFISQHSLGGILYLFGERSFSLSSTGLARQIIGATEYIRTPSTFSHPNSLAGYLLIVFYLMKQHGSPLWQRLTIFFGIILTFSKAALVALLLVILIPLNSTVVVFLSLAFSLSQIFLVNHPTSLQFISDRQFLMSTVSEIVSAKPVLGVGAGNFIVAMAGNLPGSQLIPSRLQPVHNLPYLVTSELGLFGVVLLVCLVLRYRQKLLNNKALQILAIVFVIGCFDHYWWTLPQNRLILLLAFGLMI